MPNHDLIAVWEEHLRSEFVAHDADAAMDTMVPDACVNHVPTMTGGVGHDEVKRFYKYHFVNAHPPDIEIIPVSRTVGTDSIVDEMIGRASKGIPRVESSPVFRSKWEPSWQLNPLLPCSVSRLPPQPRPPASSGRWRFCAEARCPL